MENDYNDKASCVISLYQRLMEWKVIDKEAEAAKYGASEIKKLKNCRKVRIKEKRINTLCLEGVWDAIKFKNIWMIPKDVDKPRGEIIKLSKHIKVLI